MKWVDCTGTWHFGQGCIFHKKGIRRRLRCYLIYCSIKTCTYEFMHAALKVHAFSENLLSWPPLRRQRCYGMKLVYSRSHQPLLRNIYFPPCIYSHQNGCGWVAWCWSRGIYKLEIHKRGQSSTFIPWLRVTMSNNSQLRNTCLSRKYHLRRWKLCDT